MHNLSYNEMAANIEKHLNHLPEKSMVVDVGSMDFNGTYRPLIEPRLIYMGMDISAGPNVDHVMSSEFNSGLPEAFADAIISGQCLEHCRNPFALVAEMSRIAKPGAIILLTAPCQGWIEHRFPIDCFRFLPDGMRALLDFAEADCIAAYAKAFQPGAVPAGEVDGTDCWGIGRKR